MSADSAALARRCGVLGSPIGHSLSPVLHRAAYRALGLDWEYDAHEVTAEELPEFLAGLAPAWRGLSLTMPLKRTAIGLCDRVESLGRTLGSINTVLIADDGARWGYNTDVPGLVKALRAAGVRQIDSAVIVGGGATASSALAAVGQLGGHRATVLARSVGRAARLVDLGATLDVSVAVRGLDALTQVRPADLVVSTLPAAGQRALAVEVAALAPVVFDVVYHPPDTALLAAVEQRGGRAVGGFELLLHQAARQVELMTGVAAAPVDAMRSAGLAALSHQ